MAAVATSPRILTPSLFAGFTIVVLVLIGALVIGLANLRDVSEAADAVAHTHEVKRSLQQLLATLVDAETGERGFVITGTTAYLDPYERAEKDISSRIAETRRLTTDNRKQQDDLDRIAALSARKIDELARAIKARQESGFATAQKEVADNVGKQIMDDVRVVVRRMEDREDLLLATRTSNAAQSYRSARVTRFTSTAIALVAVVVLFFIARRFGSERLRAAGNAERLRVTLASIADAVIATDDHGRVVWLNSIAERLTGWTESEATGRRLEEIFVIINDETRRPAENPIGRVLRERVVVGLANHTVLIAKDGREIPVDDSAAPIRTANGSLAGAIMVFRDVSERRRVDRERTAMVEAERRARAEAEAARREAQHANALKDQFLATVSHELRAPLNAVLGWAEMLRRDILEGPRRQRALDAVYVNAKRQSELIDDLLDVARIVSGKMRIERTAVNLQTVIRDALVVTEPSAQAKRISVSVACDESIGLILGDAARLQQVVWNLLSNAVKFTPDGGSIQLSARGAGEFVEIAVADTGKGIAPEFVPAVFEPFRQADSTTTRAHGGLGLGLSIVKHLVEAHAGTVGVESAGEGRGATFTVRLPIVPVYADAANNDEPVRHPQSHVAAESPSPSALLGLTVLVVDDDEESRQLLTASLESCGAGVVTAGSAAEALRALDSRHVDVLLSDVAMPGEDGYSLIRKVRARERSGMSQLPAAALTSFARDDDRRQAIEAGFHIHLAKPIDTRTLVKAVGSLAQAMRTS